MGNCSGPLWTLDAGCCREACGLGGLRSPDAPLWESSERLRSWECQQSSRGLCDLCPSLGSEKNRIFFCFLKAYPSPLPLLDPNTLPSLILEGVCFTQLVFCSAKNPQGKRWQRSATCLEWSNSQTCMEHSCYLVLEWNVATKMSKQMMKSLL